MPGVLAEDGFEGPFDIHANGYCFGIPFPPIALLLDDARIE